MSKPAGIIFDWDNTLVDTWPIIHKALSSTFEEMGKPGWTIEEVRSRVQHSMRDSFPVLFGDDWEKAAKIYQGHYLSRHLEELLPLPGAADMLDYLSGKGIFTAIVSNKKGPNLRKEVAHLGWDDYFSTVVGADDAARDKPHADPVHMALAGSGLSAGEGIWFIGDSAIDLECAMNASMPAVFFGEYAEKDHLTQVAYQGFPFMQYVRNHKELTDFFKNNF